MIELDIKQAKEILFALAEGVDPTTGEVLDADNVCNKGDVVRAFHTILQVLDKKPKKNMPENAGKPWSKEEEERLKELYKSGLSKKEISKELGRTTGSICSRLNRWGMSND